MVIFSFLQFGSPRAVLLLVTVAPYAAARLNLPAAAPLSWLPPGDPSEGTRRLPAVWRPQVGNHWFCINLCYSAQA